MVKNDNMEFQKLCIYSKQHFYVSELKAKTT